MSQAMTLSRDMPEAASSKPSLFRLLRETHILFLLALATDFFTPYFIWQGSIPASLRWLSHLAIVMMVGFIYMRMTTWNRFPTVFFLLVWMAATWGGAAYLRGQGILPTVWGIWVMFQFPLVGLFAYLQPNWPARFSQLLMKLCILLLIANVIFQIGQFFTGMPVGDSLTGFFGEIGHGKLVNFIFLVLCMTLGQWLAFRDWKPMVLVLVLGAISSALGEMKIFAPAAVFLCLLTIVIFTFQTGQVWKLVPYTAVVGVVLVGFFALYNTIVPVAERRPIHEFLLNPQQLMYYLERTDRRYEDGKYIYNIGRNAALGYGMEAIQKDTPTFLFGYGLGARGESRSLGTAGQRLQDGELGHTTGTTLLVFMQELGVVGLSVVGGFFLWVIFALGGDIRRYPHSDARSLRYALILFTLLWPVWLWFNNIWLISRVAMLLYWLMLGYVFSERWRLRTDTAHPQSFASEHMPHQQPASSSWQSIS